MYKLLNNNLTGLSFTCFKKKLQTTIPTNKLFVTKNYLVFIAVGSSLTTLLLQKIP